jgi:L-cystine transport system permease protein
MPKLLAAIPTTLELTVVTVLISLPISFGVAIARMKRVPVLNRVLGVYISFTRAIPPILLILIIFNSVPSLLAALFAKLDLGISIFDMNPIVYAFIFFIFYYTAVLSEVLRAALSAVDKGQLEAALSIGMTELQAYLRIIIPQALTASIPVFCSTVIDIVKMTSLAFAMTVVDITAVAKIEAGLYLAFIEAYIDLAVVYFVLVFVIERLFRQAEKRFRIARA